tara:strand:- start:1224 stop:3515 length:2292 start_codon:yes stop_codon:yes gene_type:complete
MFNLNFKYLIVIIILQGILFSESYNIVGTILDLDTKEPISDGTVFLKKYEQGTNTNKDGYFQLIINGKLEETTNLSIKMLGYEEKLILVVFNDSKIDLGKIYLKSKPIEVKAAEIHSHDNPSKQISDISIAGSELDGNLKSNIAMTLANYPNIGINSYGSVTSKPAVRGFSGDRFLLIKDGSETGDLSQSAIDHVIALDMTQVENIEIIRGPKSLLFGGNAIGGVVNTNLIGHPKIRVNKIYQKYFIGTESYNSGIYGNMMLYIPLLNNNQLNFFISDRKTENEVTAIEELNNTQSHIANYKFGLTNYNKKGYLNFAYEDFNMDYGIPPNIDGGHVTGVDILLNKKSSEINYHQDISNISSQIDIKYNYIDYIHLELVDGSVNNENIFELFDDNNYHLALAKKTHDFQIELSSNDYTYGLEYNQKHFNPYGYYLTPETGESFFSLYGFQDKSLKNFDFLSSFRLGYLQVNPKNVDGIQYINLDSAQVKKRDFKAVSFSFGLRKKINKFELNSWFMHTMRPPRVEELYSDGPHLGTYAYEIGNPELEIEKIYGIENALNYKSETIDLSFITFYNYSPYYYEITKMGDCPEALDWDPLSGTSHPCAGSDFIDWGSGEFGFLYKYNTRGSEATIKGLELNLDYKLKKIKLSYNFSLVHGYNSTLNMPLSYMNPMKQVLNIDYNLKFIDYKIRFSKIHSQNRLGEFETYTPGAFLTDFIISYRYKRFNLTIQLNNIFDEAYYNHLSRIKNITPEPGRNITFNCKIML